MVYTGKYHKMTAMRISLVRSDQLKTINSLKDTYIYMCVCVYFNAGIYKQIYIYNMYTYIVHMRMFSYIHIYVGAYASL